MCDIIVMAAVLHIITFHISYTKVPVHSHNTSYSIVLVKMATCTIVCSNNTGNLKQMEWMIAYITGQMNKIFKET